MQLQIIDGFVSVTLSRRNLEGLLAQLDDNAADAAIMRRVESGELLSVYVQEDADHYGDRPAGASGPGQKYGEKVS